MYCTNFLAGSVAESAVISHEVISPNTAGSSAEGPAAFGQRPGGPRQLRRLLRWAIASTRFLPRWVGWLAIASGAGLALSRISWTSPIWLAPYLMFWLWVITVAVLLLRSSFRGVARSG